MYHFFRDLLSLESMTKEVVEKLGMNIEKINFVSIYNVYGGNNGAIVVTTSLRIDPTHREIYTKYHLLRNHAGKEFVIIMIESEDQKSDIFTKGLQGELLLWRRGWRFTHAYPPRGRVSLWG